MIFIGYSLDIDWTLIGYVIKQEKHRKNSCNNDVRKPCRLTKHMKTNRSHHPTTGQSGRLGPFSSRGQTGELRSPGTWGKDPGGALQEGSGFFGGWKNPCGKSNLTMEIYHLLRGGYIFKSSNGLLFFFLNCHVSFQWCTHPPTHPTERFPTKHGMV